MHTHVNTQYTYTGKHKHAMYTHRNTKTHNAHTCEHKHTQCAHTETQRHNAYTHRNTNIHNAHTIVSSRFC